jgi:hypothetical protein
MDRSISLTALAFLSAILLSSTAALADDRCTAARDALPKADPVVVAESDKVDLNTGSPFDFGRISAIGSSGQPTKIIELIMSNRPYPTTADLMNQTNISCDVILGILPWVKVSDDPG